MFSALAGINALLIGVIPAIRFDGYGEPMGFFDMIQFVPSASSIFAIISMSAIIIAAIFSFIKSIPKTVSLAINGIAFFSSLIAVLGLDIGVLYKSSGIAGGGNLPVGRGLNYGVQFTFVIFVFLFFCFAAAVLSFASILIEKKAARTRRHSRRHTSKRHHTSYRSEFKRPERIE